jgi:outer membrane protein OmpA-like peptidoglycan-associated protein
MRRQAILAATALMAASVLSPAIGFAQSSPSAEQIVRSLTPTSTTGATRGIRIAPTAAAPQAAAPSVSLTVQFANGSADLSPAAIEVLNNLGKALSDPTLSAYRFRIEGHTDTVGSRTYNQTLSDRRAATVVEYLATNFRVDRSRVQGVGMGEDGLLVPTPDQTPEPRNRRVQVVNLGS